MDAAIEARPEIDQDIANVTGAPSIPDTIRASINGEDVVCDVSIVRGLTGMFERERPTRLAARCVCFFR
jgi:hypothetical protein